jgi:hypothetical protein
VTRCRVGALADLVDALPSVGVLVGWLLVALFLAGRLVRWHLRRG